MLLKMRSLLILIFVLIFSAPVYSQVPDSTRQIVLVITGDADAQEGTITFFEREEKQPWEKVGISGPIMVGRTGLANGLGLHNTEDITLPDKVEGDGKSPAGIFSLSNVFAFDSADGSPEMPFIRVAEALECVDDSKSEYYTQIVNSDSVDKVDWNSSEMMYETTPYYLQGIVAEHNTNAVPGRGSCIFLHYWKTPGEATAGCTAMKPDLLNQIIQQLDIKKNPALVQLTDEDYKRLKEKWELPEYPRLTAE
jgi:D-alanyl-D-alanine dipeptidase